MKKNEAIIVLCIAFVAVALSIFSYISKQEGDYVIITVNNTQYATLPLDSNAVFNINDTNVIEIKNNSVHMIEARCHDHLCIKQGNISDDSKNIVCLPNKIVVSITKKSSIDSISQ